MHSMCLWSVPQPPPSTLIWGCWRTILKDQAGLDIAVGQEDPIRPLWEVMAILGQERHDCHTQ